MELTPFQRKAAFAVIVLVLAGLGAFLLLPGSHPAGSSARGKSSASAGPTVQPTSQASAVATPSGGPSTPPPTGPANIYQWLPFSQAGLTSAAGTVRQFAADYATYTYNESAAAYVGRMKGLVTAQLAATLARGYATPGVAQLRVRQKQSATGSGDITSIRGFGGSSIVFLVTVAQQVRSTSGTSRTSTAYAVTVTGAGSRWQVSDIELASAGNS
jgi:hypothetical protein